MYLFLPLTKFDSKLWSPSLSLLLLPTCSLTAAPISLGSGLLCPPGGHLSWSCSLLIPLTYTHEDISLFSWFPHLLLYCRGCSAICSSLEPFPHLELCRFLCGSWNLLLSPFGPHHHVGNLKTLAPFPLLSPSFPPTFLRNHSPPAVRQLQPSRCL